MELKGESPSKKNFMDVGCGIGKVLLQSQLYFKTAIGIEFSPLTYNIGVKLLKNNNVPAVILNLDVKELREINNVHIIYDFNIGMDEDARLHLRNLIDKSTSVEYILSFYKEKKNSPMNFMTNIGETSAVYEEVYKDSTCGIYASKGTFTCHIYHRLRDSPTIRSNVTYNKEDILEQAIRVCNGGLATMYLEEEYKSIFSPENESRKKRRITNLNSNSNSSNENNEDNNNINSNRSVTNLRNHFSMLDSTGRSSRLIVERAKLANMPRYVGNINNSCYISSVGSLFLSDFLFRNYVLKTCYNESLNHNNLLLLLRQMGAYDCLDGGVKFFDSKNNIITTITRQIAENAQLDSLWFQEILHEQLISANNGNFTSYLYNLVSKSYEVTTTNDSYKPIVPQTLSYLQISSANDEGEIQSVGERIEAIYKCKAENIETGEMATKSLHFGYSVIVAVTNSIFARYRFKLTKTLRTGSKHRVKKMIEGSIRLLKSISLKDSETIVDSDGEERRLKGFILHLSYSDSLVTVEDPYNCEAIPSNRLSGHYVTFIKDYKNNLFYKVDDLDTTVTLIANCDSFEQLIVIAISTYKVSNYPVIELLLYTDESATVQQQLQDSFDYNATIQEVVLNKALKVVESLHRKMIHPDHLLTLRSFTETEEKEIDIFFDPDSAKVMAGHNVYCYNNNRTFNNEVVVNDLLHKYYFTDFV